MDLKHLNQEDLKNLSNSFYESFASQGFTRDSSYAYLSRKYQSYLFSGKLPTWGFANDSKEIVCSYSVLQIPYLENGNKIKIGLVCDVLTKPNFQKKGLFELLGNNIKESLYRESIDFTIGFPVRENITSQHIKVGWEHLFDMHLWISTLVPFSINTSLVKVSKLDREFNFSQIKFGFNHKLAIDPISLQTRFGRIDETYTVLRVQDSNQFAIIRKAKIGRVTFLAIIHIQFEGIEDGKLLFNSIRQIAFRQRIPIVAGCWNDSYASELQLKNLGFFKTTKVQNFIVREINSKVIKEEEAYRLSWLDTDAL